MTMQKESATGNRGGKICVSLCEPTVAATVAAMADVGAGADLVEIRLDRMERPELQPLFAAATLPLLFTNRAGWEGGYFQGDEQQRLAPLLKAVELGADYVDLEVLADKAWRQQLLAACQQGATKLILSWHDFKGTPSPQALLQILQRQYRSGAHMGKIVTMARQPGDVLRVLHLLEEATAMGFPLTAFCMGRVGAISRLATLEMGGALSYAAAEGSAKTAPGQLTAAVLRRMWAEFDHAH